VVDQDACAGFVKLAVTTTTTTTTITGDVSQGQTTETEIEEGEYLYSFLSENGTAAAEEGEDGIWGRACSRFDGGVYTDVMSGRTESCDKWGWRVEIVSRPLVIWCGKVAIYLGMEWTDAPSTTKH
jgi:hypothetical protein